METHRAGVGGHLDDARDGAVLFHAVGLIAEAEEDVRLDAASRQLPGELVHGGGADAAAHDGDLLILAQDVGHIEAVAHGAGELEAVTLFQGSQLAGPLAHDGVQELDGLGLGIPLVDADGPGQEGSFICAPGAQGEELSGVGGMLAVRPEGSQQADVVRDDLMAQDSGLTAGCTHGQWPPSCSHTRCKRPRRRLRPAASCRPAGCRGWS